MASPIMRYFSFDHLQPAQREISKEFFALALSLDEDLLDGPEKSVALRKLLESKDAAVRASLDTEY